MKFFERLKKIIGVDLSELKGIKFSFNINNKTIVDKSTKTVIINPGKFGSSDYRALQRLMTEGVDETGAILEENSVPVVESVLEALPSIQRSIDIFQEFIPPQDRPLFTSCLYLRHRFAAGIPVDDLKYQISQVYGIRGCNFANLVSAGYLESFFEPLLTQLRNSCQNETDLVKAKFLEHYTVIVSDLPWTEFVAASTPSDEVIKHVVGKLQRNLESGIRHINIHGLGKANIKKILRILPEIKRQTGAEQVRITQEPDRIFVRLEIPRRALKA